MSTLQTQTLHSSQGISCVSQFPQGKTYFHYREPLFSLQGPCFHYKDFPVNPCTSLLGIAVCLSQAFESNMVADWSMVRMPS